VSHDLFAEVPHHRGMSTTPTKEELDAEIVETRKNLIAARQMQSYTHNGRQIQRARIAELRGELKELQRERMLLDGVFGPQAVVGRAYRG